MTVTSSAKDLTIDSRTRVRIPCTNSNFRIVHITHEEVGCIFIAWRECSYILCSTTTATTKDYTRWSTLRRTINIAIETIQRTNCTTRDANGTFSAGEERLTIIADIIP